jgi:hypothetical protein
LEALAQPQGVLAPVRRRLRGGEGPVVRVRRRHPFCKLLLLVIAVGFITDGLFFMTSVRFRVPFVDVNLMVLAVAGLGRRPWLGGQEVAPDRRSAA